MNQNWAEWWVYDPLILLRQPQIWPRQETSIAQQLNAITTFLLIVILILYLLDYDHYARHLLIWGILTIILTGLILQQGDNGRVVTSDFLQTVPPPVWRDSKAEKPVYYMQRYSPDRIPSVISVDSDISSVKTFSPKTDARVFSSAATETFSPKIDLNTFSSKASTVAEPFHGFLVDQKPAISFTPTWQMPESKISVAGEKVFFLS